MIIGVDVHDVTAELVSAWVAAFNQMHGASLKVEEVTDWDWNKVVGSPHGRDLFYELFTPELQARLEPVPGAFDAISDLAIAGHRIVYATATYGVMFEAVHHWLVDWSFLPEYRGSEPDLISAGDKGLLRLDVLVDDKYENVMACRRAGGMGILFDRPWNRKFSYLPCAHDWQEVLRIIRGWQDSDGAQPCGIPDYPQLKSEPHPSEKKCPEQAKNESVEDTLADLSVYAVIGQLLRKGVWGK